MLNLYQMSISVLSVNQNHKLTKSIILQIDCSVEVKSIGMTWCMTVFIIKEIPDAVNLPTTLSQIIVQRTILNPFD